MTYYIDRGPAFILPEAREFFLSRDIEVLSFEKANATFPDRFFDNFSVKGGILALPKPGRINTPLPYDPLTHYRYLIDGAPMSDLIENFVQNNFGHRKYIASARPDVFLCIAFNIFSYDILSHIYSGHLTTPMVLYSDDCLSSILFEFDLEINTVSMESTSLDASLAGKPRSFWIEYFNANFLESIEYNEHHVNIVKNYYSPLIPGLRISS